MVVAALLESWLPFLIYGTLALVIPASMIVMSFVFAQRPARRTRARTIPFESGVSTGPPKQQRFTVSFYLTAMLFIVFDIEIVFLYPLAVMLEHAKRRPSSAGSPWRHGAAVRARGHGAGAGVGKGASAGGLGRLRPVSQK